MKNLKLAGLAIAGLTLSFASGCGASFHYDPAPRAAALPMQACPAPIFANHARVRLPSGIYRCDIVVRGNNNRVIGSRNTVIQGNLVVRGHGNRINRLRVDGRTLVAGHNNRINRRVISGRRVVQRTPHWYYRY